MAVPACVVASWLPNMPAPWMPSSQAHSRPTGSAVLTVRTANSALAHCSHPSFSSWLRVAFRMNHKSCCSPAECGQLPPARQAKYGWISLYRLMLWWGVQLSPTCVQLNGCRIEPWGRLRLFSCVCEILHNSAAPGHQRFPESDNKKPATPEGVRVSG
jgi:hypothetical protein